MNQFKQFLKTELNKQQKEAVTQKTGAMIVIAGAGSGKTRVITARMANLIINENTDPQSILALTFTNKAAGEMKERLSLFLSRISRLPFVGTFHSYSLLLLRTNPGLLPFTDFSIMDEDDQRSLLKKIIKKNNLEKQLSPSQLSHQISKVKNQVNQDDDETFKNPAFKEVFLAYESEKANAHCLDFDDLLLSLLKIFQTNKAFKEKFQSQVKHILVDEYQDTNGVQHELLREMALNTKKKFVLDSLCAVGDEDQSIYSWRGAKVTNMLSFQNDFAPVTLLKIEQNYRSVQPILKAANKVIEHNTKRHPKKLWSERQAKNRILCLSCQSGYQEADVIATYIKTLPEKIKLRNIAILYRTHFQSRSIEESLIRSSIPYVIIGGIRFYERKEIKDLLAYLRLIVNPFDRASLFRIINIPGRGLGAKFEELLYKEWNKNTLLDFKQILQYLLDSKNHKITGTKATSIKQFINIFKKLDKTKRPTILLDHILEKTAYLGHLRKVYDENDAETKIENIQEFGQSIENFEKNVIAEKHTLSQAEELNKKPTLENFLLEIALLQEKLEGNKEETDHIQMMTLHAAKGLEFNTVIIAGLEEGLFPSTKSLHSDDAVEEERRLFYVGMTRAKERLVLIRAMYRNTYGQIMDQEISRFLTEIPTRLAYHIDLAQTHPARVQKLFSEWLCVPLTNNITTFNTTPIKRKPAKSKTNKKSFKAEILKMKPATLIPANKTTSKATIPWRKNHPVLHQTFGTGVIKKVEKSTHNKYYLTILFRIGEKRILSTFVQAL